MKLALLPLAASASALGGCAMSYEDCREDALKEWQECAREAIGSPRSGSLGDCALTHRREAEACAGLPREGDRAAETFDRRSQRSADS